jgi:hypothetical protein
MTLFVAWFFSNQGSRLLGYSWLITWLRSTAIYLQNMSPYGHLSHNDPTQKKIEMLA